LFDRVLIFLKVNDVIVLECLIIFLFRVKFIAVIVFIILVDFILLLSFAGFLMLSYD
jgi:hypothetical protein